MFDNIGSKIMGLAQVVCWIGIIVFCVLGLVLMFTAEIFGFMTILLGIVIAAVGSLFSWIGSLALYGFGELIENTAYIRKEVCDKNAPAAAAEASPAGHLSSVQPLSSPAKRVAPNEWKCPKCQKIHKSYETSCVCGYNKNRPQG